YYPYGSTSYLAGRSAAEVSLKRYRYTNQERDKESGFYYHGARYYAPWLARWTSADPIGLASGDNLYTYVNGNPITNQDPTGTNDVCGVYDEDEMVCRQVACDEVETLYSTNPFASYSASVTPANSSNVSSSPVNDGPVADNSSTDAIAP